MVKRVDNKNSVGLSKSTKSLLIVVIAIMVIVIIFLVVRGLSNPNDNGNPVDRLTADLKISQVEITNNTDLSVKVDKGTVEGELKAVNFIFYDENGKEIKRSQISVSNLESNDYLISFRIINTSKIKSISINPIFVNKSSGGSVIGKVEDEYTMTGEENTNQGNSEEQTPEENTSSEVLPECTLDSQCNDNNGCTTDSCVDGNCSHTLVENCVPCSTSSQCDDSNACTTNVCSEGKCSYLAIPGCTPCGSNINCEDNNSCTNNLCIQGRCLYTPIASCKSCTLNSECEDNDPCTANSCSNGACTFTSISNCKACTLSFQCEDNNSSTASACLNGKCVYTKITSCISNDGYCPSGCNAGNDNDCSYICGNGIREGTEKCDGTNLGGATCSGVLGVGYTGTLKCFSGLCTFDTSLCVAPCTCLSDNNICTTDQCVNNVCQHTPLTGNSCTNDNNVCTNDLCGANGTCVHAPISGCCTSNSQCGNGQTCTGNVCVATSNPPTATCGDGSCNGAETCSNCSQDCGTCYTPLKTYYISPSGSDSTGNGSSIKPWKSLAYACSSVTTSGSLIHVKAGNYTETAQCNLAVGVSIEGEGPVNSIIKSHVTGSVYSNAFTIMLVSPSTTNGNQHISNIKMDGDSLTAYGAIYVEKRSNVEISHCMIVHFFYYALGFDGGNSKSGGYFVPPVTYPTGNKVYDCIIDDCSAYYPANEPVSGEGKGAITVDGQEGMLIYNNVLTQTSRASGNNGYLIKGVAGMNKGLKIFNNTIVKAPYDGTTWDFAIELWMCRGGVEIYNNDITGSVDISGSGGELTASTHKTGSYTYGVWIHDNYIHQINSNIYEGIRGILIEQSAEDVIIERNHIKNVTTGIYMPLGYAGSTLKNINISYNILENIGGPDWQAWGFLIANPGGYTCDNVNINNNVITARDNGLTTVYGIEVPIVGATTNVNIRNNIVQGFDKEPIYAEGSSGETLKNLNIENNIFYNNGNNNQPAFSDITPNPYSYIKNKEGVDPRFVSSTNFHLQSNSLAINNGANVGLTKDYEGNAIVGLPDIGAYEYGSAPACTVISYTPVISTFCGSKTVVDNCGYSSTKIGTLTCSGTCTNNVCQTSSFSNPLPSALRIFYVNATTGSDSNTGTSPSSPWKTISKVNSYSSFKAGDAILFRRGDIWYDSLTVSSSGNSNNPITFSAYGTGNMPVITGFTTINGWTNEGNGIYSKVVPTQSSPNMVTVDGVNTWMGRYPDTGWLTYESSGDGYIVDNQLSSSPDWTGAEVVIKKEGYITDRSSITRHSGNTIYYDKSSTVGDDGNAGWGYFIENDIRTLTTLGEWYYDDNTNKFYMYFGSVNPTTKIIKVASLNTGISSSQSYITIDNINFQGFNSVGLNLDNSNHITVTNCEVGFTGAYGVVMGTNNLYDNLYLHDTNADGFSGSSDGFTLTNSIIENVGMIEGSGYGYGGRGSAMDYWGSNALIQYNTFRNIGLVAVGQIGNDVTIDSNFFDNCCNKSLDCGAIYMNNNGGNRNRVVSNNIIINTIGTAEGTHDSNNYIDNMWSTVEGIYLDEPCSGVTIEGNTVANIRGSGIKLHEAHDIIIRDNTIYNAFEGYQFLGSGAQPNNPIRNVDMDNNIVVAIDASQFIFVFMAHTLNDINQFGTSDNQYYVRPINDRVMHDFWTNQASDGDWGNFRAWSTNNPAPAGTWQAKIGQQDLDSHFSEGLVASTNDIRFEYNPTKTNKVIVLSGNYVDVKGKTYSGSVTLQPYSSVVLIRN